MSPEELIERLLYRDGLLLVINKPAGLPVHRGPKGGESLEDSFDGLRFGLPRSPGLAHRLDRDTSGCLVLGRHRKALEKVGLLFKQSKIDKTYWAVVEGHVPEDHGFIDLPLGRLDAQRGWWMKVDPAGLPSQTRWSVMGRGQGPAGEPITWLALSPITGRTHQLRVHCTAMGWSIVGDPIYGSGPRHFGEGLGELSLQLHARKIVIPMSKNKEPIVVEAPIPDHMVARMSACGWTLEMDTSLVRADQKALDRNDA